MDKDVPLVGIILFCTVLALVYPTIVASQSAQPHPVLNTVIQDVRRAESAGAQPDEMGRLVSGLNSVLHLEDQLNSLRPQDVNAQEHLQHEINSSLVKLDSEANQIAASASQRTSIEHSTAYVLGGVGALIATVATYWALAVRRLARRKRVLHLTIIPKEGRQE